MKSQIKLFVVFFCTFAAAFCSAGIQEKPLHMPFKALKNLSKLPELKLKSQFKSPSTYHTEYNGESCTIQFPGLYTDFSYSLNNEDYESLVLSLSPKELWEEEWCRFLDDDELEEINAIRRCMAQIVDLFVPQEGTFGVYATKKSFFGVMASPIPCNRDEYISHLLKICSNLQSVYSQDDDVVFTYSTEEENGLPILSLILQTDISTLYGKIVMTEKNVFIAASSISGPQSIKGKKALHFIDSLVVEQ